MASLAAGAKLGRAAVLRPLGRRPEAAMRPRGATRLARAMLARAEMRCPAAAARRGAAQRGRGAIQACAPATLAGKR